MGINAVWQNENGVEIDRVDDPQSYFSLLVLATPLDEFVCLRFVDPYGDTYFNRLQKPVLLIELARVRAVFTDSLLSTYYADQVRQARTAGLQETVIEQLAARQGLLIAHKVQEHVDVIAALVERSVDRLHTYIRLVGD